MWAHQYSHKLGRTLILPAAAAMALTGPAAANSSRRVSAQACVLAAQKGVAGVVADRMMLKMLSRMCGGTGISGRAGAAC